MQNSSLYQKLVVDPIDLMPKSAHLIYEVIAEVQDHGQTLPIYKVSTVDEWPPTRGDIFISAGVHGDEVAGVKALVTFIEEYSPRYLDKFRLHMYPCLNPIGLNRGTRDNGDGVDINRTFGGNNRSVEGEALIASLKKGPSSYLIGVDLHEDSPHQLAPGFESSPAPEGMYFYESCRGDVQRVGDKVRDSLTDVQFCSEPTIYGDLNERGIIKYPAACRNAVYKQRSYLDAYLFDNYAPYTITTETPMGLPVEERTRIQLRFLMKLLELI